uniref:hypothetical protein n=1 Tax=Actinomadura sp. CA-154981 TaxID=3240037 RepID=UPI003F493CB8
MEEAVATAWRYAEETVTLLPARSPKLGGALRKARTDGLTYLVPDGTLIHTDRVKVDCPRFPCQVGRRGAMRGHNAEGSAQRERVALSRHSAQHGDFRRRASCLQHGVIPLLLANLGGGRTSMAHPIRMPVA